jgi:hypothetical protein
MFTGSLTEEVKNLEEQIDAVMDKVEDPVLCTKVKQFVYAPRAIQDELRDEACPFNSPPVLSEFFS